MADMNKAGTPKQAPIVPGFTPKQHVVVIKGGCVVAVGFFAFPPQAQKITSRSVINRNNESFFINLLLFRKNIPYSSIVLILSKKTRAIFAKSYR